MKKASLVFLSLSTCFFLLSSCKKEKDSTKNGVSFEDLQAAFRTASISADNLLKEKFGANFRYSESVNSLSGNPAPPVTVEEAEGIVQPLIDPSAEFLNSYYDINVYDFFSPGDPEIARLGALALRFKQLEEQGLAVDTLQMEDYFNTSAFSNHNGVHSVTAPGNSIVDCAMSALGIPASLIVGSAKDLSRRALLKAARKLASRTIGWIGLGIAIYQFGDCMDWW